MRIYFVRHGESEANILHVISNKGLKHGLTEQGRKQAIDLADKLRGTLVRRIYSSPILRAVQTAAILSDKLSVPFESVDALREYDCGVVEGRSDDFSWNMYNRVAQDWLEGRWESRIEGGESFLDIRARFCPFIEELMRKYHGSSENIVLVGHGGIYRHMLPLILKNIDAIFSIQKSYWKYRNHRC